MPSVEIIRERKHKYIIWTEIYNVDFGVGIFFKNKKQPNGTIPYSIFYTSHEKYTYYIDKLIRQYISHRLWVFEEYNVILTLKCTIVDLSNNDFQQNFLNDS